MNRLLVLLLPFALSLHCLAQKDQQGFDAVGSLGTLNIFRAWSPDAFPLPFHAERLYTDSLRSNDDLVGFTLQFRDRDTTGWRMWLDFDADKFRAMRLSRVFAQKVVPDGDTSVFSATVDRIDSLLQKRIMDRKPEGPDLVSWRWIPREGYRLAARRVSDHHAGTSYITLTLSARQ